MESLDLHISEKEKEEETSADMDALCGHLKLQPVDVNEGTRSGMMGLSFHGEGLRVPQCSLLLVLV